MNRSKAKIASKSLLITLLLLFSTMAFIIPMSGASPGVPITAKYIFEYLDGVAEWIVSPDELHGAYVAHLKCDHSTFSEYAYVRVYPDLPTPITMDTLLTVGIPEFDYYLTTAHTRDIAPELELLFTWVDYTPAVGNGWVEITLCPSPGSYHYTIQPETWHTATADGTIFAVAFGKATDGTLIDIAVSSKKLSDLITDIKTADASAGDWELTRVSPQTGWLSPDGVSEAYIDNVKVGDVTYELEPQILTVGTTYDITIARALPGALVKLTDVDGTTVLGQDYVNILGYVTIYGITPAYGGNYSLSDWGITSPHTIPKFIRADWDNCRVDFLAQPSEDLTVSVSVYPSSVAHEITALEVTVTNASGPVPGAYVNVEFWDNEATSLHDGNTTLLQASTITTATNGKAIFDVEVDVAGTIYFIAGTDLGGVLEYFDHWGMKTVPVSALDAVEITTTPSTLTQGIPSNLNITLENSPSTLQVLQAATEAYSINITLTGDDMNMTAQPSDADSGLDYQKLFNAAEEVTTFPAVSDVWVIQCKYLTDKPTFIILPDFKSEKLANIVVTANVDIGGVTAGELATLGIPKAVDGLADYLDTGAKTITVTVPGVPAEVSGQETLDPTGAPKTSFALGETVLISASVTNIGAESQPMLILVQLTDPDLRALAPTFIGVTLLPGQSLTPSIGFILPPTGYAAGIWTAKIMVLDKWPALGGVAIAAPVTVTFTVTS